MLKIYTVSEVCTWWRTEEALISESRRAYCTTHYRVSPVQRYLIKSSLLRSSLKSIGTTRRGLLRRPKLYPNIHMIVYVGAPSSLILLYMYPHLCGDIIEVRRSRQEILWVLSPVTTRTSVVICFIKDGYLMSV